MSTGMMSSVALVAGGVGAVPLDRQERQRRRGREALVPACERDSAAPTRRSPAARCTRARPVRAPRAHLVAERLGVRVRVGPAPVLRALHAEVGELLGDPHLALALHRDLERALVVGVAPFVLEARGALVAELRDVGAIVGARLDLIDDALAVGDLGIDARSRRRAACRSACRRRGPCAGSSRRAARPPRPRRRGCRRRSRSRCAPPRRRSCAPPRARAWARAR